MNAEAQPRYPVDAIEFSLIQRVLVIKLRHIGDVLLTSPMFSALKSAHPHLQIDALVYEDTASMLHGHPGISTVLTVPRKKVGGALSKLQQDVSLLNELKAKHYDGVIHLTESYRGAWIARWIKPKFSAAAEYRERRGTFWRSSFTHLVKQSPRLRHTVEKHLDHIRRLGVHPSQAARQLSIHPNDEAIKKVGQLLNTHALTRSAFILIHPTSRWMFKTWPAERMANVIKALRARGLPIVVTAAPSEIEQQFIETMKAAGATDFIDLSGQLSLPELAALIAQAKLFLGVDSAPMHLAAATQTPTVALFGPSGDVEWGPWQVPHRLLTLNYSCRPCGLDGCGGGKVSDCLVNIQEEQVLDAIYSLLSEDPA